MSSVASTTIPSAYAGPPFSANGGYVAGLMAERIDARAAHVELRGPVPMDRELGWVVDGPVVALAHEDRLLATAAPATVVDMTAPRVRLVEAVRAAGDVDPTGHPFPQCFVCGPERPADGGMHLLPGPVDSGRVAVPWAPAGWQADSSGVVPTRMVTAALDCPSAFPVLERGSFALLAAMSFRITRHPRVGEALVVAGWARRVRGRKMWSASSISAANHEVLARAETLWISVEAERIALLAEQMERSAA